MGDLHEARQLLAQARRVAEDLLAAAMVRTPVKAFFVSEIAKSAANIGDLHEARRLLAQARRVAMDP